MILVQIPSDPKLHTSDKPQTAHNSKNLKKAFFKTTKHIVWKTLTENQTSKTVWIQRSSLCLSQPDFMFFSRNSVHKLFLRISIKPFSFFSHSYLRCNGGFGLHNATPLTAFFAASDERKTHIDNVRKFTRDSGQEVCSDL